MSTDLPRFLLEATLVWAALLLFYLVAFHRNAHWRVRRRFLLTAFGLGVLIPLLPAISLSGPVAAARLPADLVGYIIPTAGAAPITAADSPAYTWVEVTLAIWAAGALLYLTIAVFGLLRHLRPAAPIREMYAGFRVIRSARVSAPYAAFGRIYLPTALPPALERTALLHEAAHLRHGHPYERLLLLAGTAVFWFHPLSWVYARLLSEVHEYEADAEVTRHIPVKTYGRQLLQATLAPRLVPALFSSPLKKRIMMLTKNDLSRKISPGRWAVLLTLMLGLLVACSDGPEDFDLPSQNEPPLTFTLAQMQNPNGAPTLADDRAPSFVQAIYESIQYPAAARKRNMVGTVSAELTISETGAVLDVLTIRQPVSEDNRLVIIGYGEGGEPTSGEGSTYFTDEVQRVLTELGPFHPAMVDGNPHASRIVMDFAFNLE